MNPFREPARRESGPEILPPMRASLVFAAATILVSVILLWFLDGCAMPLERAQARGAVTALAEAARVVDASCANVARARADLELARRCERSYREARVALIAAAVGVDAWDDLDERAGAICAARRASTELLDVVHDLDKLGVRLPTVVGDAIALVGFLPACSVRDGGASTPKTPAADGSGTKFAEKPMEQSR